MSETTINGIDHEENCAACGVNERAEDSRLCESCRKALVDDSERQ